MKEDVVQQKQVQLYMGMINDDLERVNTSIAVLRDNLIPVLKETLSEPSGEEKKAELVPLARDLRDFHRSIGTILSTVNYMNEALEL